jgi:catechol 2,3-dioxygenase-like lactoylglutathione lyase family enzyme
MVPIKVDELAYIRMRAPDLALAERFLTDFGLLVAERAEGALYLRGSDAMRYCYIVEEGPSHLLGFGFHARSRADLDALAEAEGAPVEPINEPGGGFRVRLHEPNGYAVDVVHGIETHPAISVERQDSNTSANPYRRVGQLLRLPRGKPTPIRRLAHVVLGTPQVTETSLWFRDHLGMIPSDEVFVETGGPQVASFLRVDGGEDYVDHHTFLPMRAEISGLQHVSFESQDIDAVMADHHYLTKQGYEHLWGIGRHLLGSQLFDYWRDPFGYAHEHWADTDRLSASSPTGVWAAHEGLVSQWGEGAPEKFRKNVKP